MTIEITSKSITITAAIRERIESRFNKFNRYVSVRLKPHVIITQEGNQYKIEAISQVQGESICATGTKENLYSAIALMAQKFERQLKQISAKANRRRHDKTNYSIATDPLDVEAEISAAA